LLGADFEIQRGDSFLDEQVKHWTAMVRKAEDLLFQAKTELARRKMMRIGDRPPDTTEQEEAFKKAQARLEICEEKLAATKKWQRAWPEAVREYQGPARQLLFLLESELPRMQAFLERKVAALEAYMQVTRPSE
jgi:hypothetical protein